MIPARKYKELSPQLRTSAVERVRELAPQVSSRWRAICLVAETLEIHPNTLRSWVDAAPQPIPSGRVDGGRAERERALQLAAQAHLIRDLSNALHPRTSIDGAPA